MHVLIDALVLALSYVLSWYCYVRLGVMNNHPERGILPPATYMMALALYRTRLSAALLCIQSLCIQAFSGKTSGICQYLKSEYGWISGLAGQPLHGAPGSLFPWYALHLLCAECDTGNDRKKSDPLYLKQYVETRPQPEADSDGRLQPCDRGIHRPDHCKPGGGYLVRGILDDHVKAGTMYRGIKVLGRINKLSVILPENKLDEIAITLGLNEYFRLEEIVAMCEKSGVHTQFVPDYHNIIPTKPYTEDLQGLPVVNIRYVPLSNTFNAMLKRIVDIFGALVAIILFSPVMLFSCIMIKLTSPGPLIYRQTRVGLHNKPFEMYKFRSMEVQTEEKEKKAWTVKNDPRVTGFGKFMRHTSIDELPQLFNILKGDMSLVGPRPERPFFVEKFREEIPRYMVKHQVRPGLTGWAQVNGYRGDTSIRKRIDCDLYYIENWTLGLDFKILFLTFFKGFVNKNAY